ncbi:deoxyribose-phosphate aldolase [Lacrimispora sp.]|uniref:deoxyribose-phosphate aldolase n=1 Tax=Lacrimispora sp. TaxID=2719234 RepID=UPI00285C0162|nr:deoxyribose-phosphate aldolase [Lacrimispora sp.]MDR7812941.1 deoxyribose-phosphate aldolase [Lacrimispora sp.]
MDREEMMGYIDHTRLKATTTWEEIRGLCDEAVAHHTASVCIPPSYVMRVRNTYEKLNICTVIGFPLGYATKEAKVAETKQALMEGANEIDMVINLGDVKNGDFYKVKDEIAELKKAVGSDRILKVIIETCYLKENEKIELCRCVTEGGADFIKTSTGFGSGGAKPEDIELFKKHIGPNVRIKASGGIKNRAEMEAFIALGCQRIGTSSAMVSE